MGITNLGTAGAFKRKGRTIGVSTVTKVRRIANELDGGTAVQQTLKPSHPKLYRLGEVRKVHAEADFMGVFPVGGPEGTGPGREII